MRDCIRVLYYYPYLNFDSGSPKAMVQFIETLDRTIFHPLYCASETGPLTEALEQRGVEVLFNSVASIDFRAPLAAIAAVRRQAVLLRRWKIDLIHANSFLWNTDLVLAAWLLRIPVVLHVHNRQEISFQNLSRLAARKVLFCSRAAMGTCTRFDRIAGKSEVLHNMIDVDAVRRGRRIREDLGLRPDQIAIGTVAQIVHGKGIDMLLESARVLLAERDDLVFLIAGPVPAREREFGAAMLAAADLPPLRGRVRFLGSRKDIPDFLASIDLFVLPTRGEAFPMVILEAMAAGLPVIASHVGGIPEMVTSPETGRLVDPIAAEAFTAAIRDVLALPDRGKSMGEKARHSIIGRFDTATGGQRLKEIYLNVLNLGPRHSVLGPSTKGVSLSAKL